MKLHQLTGRLPLASRFSALFGALFFLSFLTSANPGEPDLSVAHPFGETAMEDAVQPVNPLPASGTVSLPGTGLGPRGLVSSGSVHAPGNLSRPVAVIRGDFCGIENPVPGVYLICCKPSKNVCIVTPEVGDDKGIFRVPGAAADSPARLFRAAGYEVSRSADRIAVRFTDVATLASSSPR